MVCGAAIYNRYPLVYSDTGAYLMSHNDGDRSIFYGLFILPARVTHTLWSVVFAQSLLATYTLRLLSREVFAIKKNFEFLAIILLLCVTSSLPWYAGFLTPDIFTSLMILGLFMLAFSIRHLDLFDRFFVFALTFLAAIVHYSHIPIATGLLIIALLVSLIRFERVRYLTTPAVVIVCAFVTIVASNYLTIGVASYSAGGYAFELGRLIEDGPAVAYLREECHRRSFRACSYLDQMPMSSSRFLWYTGYLRAGGFVGQSREAAEIVKGTIESYPAWVFKAALIDTARQIRRSGTGGGLISYADDHNPTRPLHSLYPSEFVSYLGSRQSRRQLDMSAVQIVDYGVVIVSLLACILAFIAALRSHDLLVLSFMLTIGLAILLHAFVTGAISEPINRYGARVIWLIPLTAIVSWHRALRHTKESLPPTVRPESHNAESQFPSTATE